MSETAVRPAQDEMTIDLRQMGYFVLKKWKILLIFIIVGLLLGTGLTLLKGETTLESFDTTKMDNERIQQYALYNQLYLDRLKYDRGSVIIRMDPNAVYSGSLRYYITADTVSIDFIANLFRNIMYDESIFGEDKEKASDHRFAVHPRAGGGRLGGQGGQHQIASAAELSGIPASATISVSAMARSEETCEAMLEVMRSRIAAVDAECEASYAQYTFLPMSDRIVYGYSASVANTQKEAASLKNDYVTQIKTIEEELTQDELDYFTLAYPTLTDKVLETSLLSRLKYPILLSALLFFLAVGWYAVRFVLDNHLKTPLEVPRYLRPAPDRLPGPPEVAPPRDRRLAGPPRLQGRAAGQQPRIPSGRFADVRRAAHRTVRGSCRRGPARGDGVARGAGQPDSFRRPTGNRRACACAGQGLRRGGPGYAPVAYHPSADSAGN